jgi:hypothetical protein
MNETNNWLLASGTSTLGASGISGNIGTSGTSTISNTYIGGHTLMDNLTISGNSTINYSTNQFQNNMTPKQVHVAVFTIKRDKNTNEIKSTTFVKELWVEQKNGASIDLIVAKHLDKDFNPETTIIKVLSTVSF